jgi:hypothetical protein
MRGHSKQQLAIYISNPRFPLELSVGNEFSPIAHWMLQHFKKGFEEQDVSFRSKGTFGPNPLEAFVVNHRTRPFPPNVQRRNVLGKFSDMPCKKPSLQISVVSITNKVFTRQISLHLHTLLTLTCASRCIRPTRSFDSVGTPSESHPLSSTESRQTDVD